MIKIHNNFIDLRKYDPKEDAEKLLNLLSFGKDFYKWDKQYDSIISEIANKNSEKNTVLKLPLSDKRSKKQEVSGVKLLSPHKITKKNCFTRSH